MEEQEQEVQQKGGGAGGGGGGGRGVDEKVRSEVSRSGKVKLRPPARPHLSAWVTHHASDPTTPFCTRSLRLRACR